jgi:hypothetical protein
VSRWVGVGCFGQHGDAGWAEVVILRLARELAPGADTFALEIAKAVRVSTLRHSASVCRLCRQLVSFDDRDLRVVVRECASGDQSAHAAADDDRASLDTRVFRFHCLCCSLAAPVARVDVEYARKQPADQFSPPVI